LAESHQAVETDNSICERALAAATLENVQVADGSSKLISGQIEIILTLLVTNIKLPPLID
jgi:hypothetical protein